MDIKEAEQLTEKYRGRKFVFHSPFEDTNGWQDGEQGTLLRLQHHTTDEIDEEVEDVWTAVVGECGFRDVYGFEAFDPDTGKPIVEEQQATDWSPGDGTRDQQVLDLLETAQKHLRAVGVVLAARGLDLDDACDAEDAIIDAERLLRAKPAKEA